MFASHILPVCFRHKQTKQKGRQTVRKNIENIILEVIKFGQVHCTALDFVESPNESAAKVPFEHLKHDSTVPAAAAA